MYLRTLFVFLVLNTFLPAIVIAQEFDERLISDPTKLSVIASDPAVVTTVVGRSIPIESEDSVAEIVAVEVVASERKYIGGVQVLLEHDKQVERLYLDPGQASQLRNEFAGFESWPGKDKTCEATNRCVYGVARCRPSQDLRQAVCPGFYLTANGEQGVVVSTARRSFSFPSIEPSVFVRAINAATGELDRHE